MLVTTILVARVNSAVIHSCSCWPTLHYSSNRLGKKNRTLTAITLARRFCAATTMSQSGIVAGKKAAAYKAVDEWVKVSGLMTYIYIITVL